ncbi:MAG: GNAT family N-acetyltransferase [Lentisphaerae bacterium]|nr:GNAT family N-acetyltransferase [Lentisphaerota bacterium]
MGPSRPTNQIRPSEWSELASVETSLGPLDLRVVQSVEEGEELSFTSGRAEVAYLTLVTAADALEIRKVEVAKRYRRHGVASALVSSLVVGARRRPISRLRLESVPAALPFWKAMGAECGTANEHCLHDCYIDLT